MHKHYKNLKCLYVITYVICLYVITLHYTLPTEEFSICNLITLYFPQQIFAYEFRTGSADPYTCIYAFENFWFFGGPIRIYAFWDFMITWRFSDKFSPTSLLQRAHTRICAFWEFLMSLRTHFLYMHFENLRLHGAFPPGEGGFTYKSSLPVRNSCTLIHMNLRTLRISDCFAVRRPMHSYIWILRIFDYMALFPQIFGYESPAGSAAQLGTLGWYVAACCSVLQRVAACCNVLQCVAVCCSVLQLSTLGWYVAACCIVL